MQTKLYAVGDIVTETDHKAAAGDVVATIDHELPLDKLLAGLQTGRVTTEAPNPGPEGDAPAEGGTDVSKADAQAASDKMPKPGKSKPPEAAPAAQPDLAKK